MSTDYRVLREAGESRDRRRQATHPATVKPELVATGPNQVWSWDITKLHGLHTAADVHYGRAAAVQAERAQVLTAAYLAHPERFVRKPPAPPKLPGTSWINPPPDKETGTQ